MISVQCYGLYTIIISKLMIPQKTKKFRLCHCLCPDATFVFLIRIFLCFWARQEHLVRRTLLYVLYNCVRQLLFNGFRNNPLRPTGSDESFTYHINTSGTLYKLVMLFWLRDRWHPDFFLHWGRKPYVGNINITP